MAVVAFNSTTFKATFPEFATTGNDVLAAYFVEAGFYCNNTDASVVTDVTLRGIILNLLAAHIAKLTAAPLVGRVSSAGEGSVNASTTYATPTAGRAFFDQTQYGARAWQLMGPYRHALYIGPTKPYTTYVPEG